MKIVRLIIALVVLLQSSSCAIYHHYPPMYGKIVDADTRKPLEGAVVLAVYKTWMWGSPGGASVYFLDSQEAVSDQKGEFRIPSLNAFAFRPLSTFHSTPGVKIFKPRYRCFGNTLDQDAYETIELKELMDKDARQHNTTDCFPRKVPLNKIKLYVGTLNIELIDLGMVPINLEEGR